MGNHSYAVERTEKKYALPSITKARLTERLSKTMQMDTHSGGLGYSVRSLYFDSVYDDDLFDKVNGLESRKKIRLRFYDSDPKWVKLEMKQKQKAAQVKRTMEIPREAAERLIQGEFHVLLDLGTDFSKELYQIMLCGGYRPKCIITYQRTAFTVRANDIRITIDDDIRTSKKYDAFFDCSAVLSPLMSQAVLEVKYNGFLLDSCKAIINPLVSSEISFSKYAMARQKIY